MRMYDLILKKRKGLPLNQEEIDFIVQGYVEGKIPDYQVSAFLMAAYFKGLNEKETFYLTNSMIKSGDEIDLSPIPGIKVDKHSTGGVGDKTTLVVAPLVASCGVPVAKMSGRGLGHTGGTIDKLESIPGFNVDLSLTDFIENVKKTGVVVAGQTGNLVPADKKLYALRDVTATVDNISLIASSIMSKKIAAGSDAFVLDVKTGSGAFLKKVEDSIELGKTMVKIAASFGKKAVALITDMNQPLGYAVGNSLEVKEAVKTLKGNGPKDLEDLCLALGSYMVVLGGKADNLDDAKKLLKQNLQKGKAYNKFLDMVKRQGGDIEAVEKLKLPDSTIKKEITANKSGYISKIMTEEIGRASMILGAGRKKKGDSIDLSAGIVFHKKIGDKVKEGDVLCSVYTNKQETIKEAENILNSAVEIQNKKIQRPSLIYGFIDTSGKYTKL